MLPANSGRCKLAIYTYEGMFILNPQLGDDETEKAIQEIQDEITKVDGQILHLKKMGRQNLAYPIRRFKEGYYILLYFTVHPETMERIKGKYRINEKILRYMILRIKKSEVQV